MADRRFPCLLGIDYCRQTRDQLFPYVSVRWEDPVGSVGTRFGELTAFLSRSLRLEEGGYRGANFLQSYRTFWDVHGRKKRMNSIKPAFPSKKFTGFKNGITG